MSTHLYLVFAARGKTAYVLAQARAAAQGLAAVTRVIPIHLQARAARRRHRCGDGREARLQGRCLFTGDGLEIDRLKVKGRIPEFDV